MKKLMLVLLCMGIIVVGSLSVYLYFNSEDEKEYENGMFVDRGDSHGYATMYDILKTV